MIHLTQGSQVRKILRLQLLMTKAQQIPAIQLMEKQQTEVTKIVT